MGIDLKQKLEAAGRREAEEYFKAKMPHLWKEYELDLERSHTMKAYVECHRSLHPLILKMAEALEKISISSEGFYTEGKVISERHAEIEILYVDKIARDALAELEKYLEENK